MNAPPLAHRFPRALHLSVGWSAHTGTSEAMTRFIRAARHLSGFDMSLVVCGHTAAVLATEQPELSVACIGQLPSAGVSPAIAHGSIHTPLRENDHA